MRLDTDEPLWEAVTDVQRSGRKSKLSDEELDGFQRTLQDSPQEDGYDDPAWTTLVRHHLEETYDVKCSIPRCRRSLNEAGLSYRKPWQANTKAEPEDRDRFDEDLKKRQVMDAR